MEVWEEVREGGRMEGRSRVRKRSGMREGRVVVGGKGREKVGREENSRE